MFLGPLADHALHLAEMLAHLLQRKAEREKPLRRLTHLEQLHFQRIADLQDVVKEDFVLLLEDDALSGNVKEIPREGSLLPVALLVSQRIAP